jgi:hypothetical protein
MEACPAKGSRQARVVKRMLTAVDNLQVGAFLLASRFDQSWQHRIKQKKLGIQAVIHRILSV